MVTSRSVPQQTAHIFSALAGQNRSALRFSQIGQEEDTSAPQREKTVPQNTLAKDKTQKAGRAPIPGRSALREPLDALARTCTRLAKRKHALVSSGMVSFWRVLLHLVQGISALSGVFATWTWLYFSLASSDSFHECSIPTSTDLRIRRAYLAGCWLTP
jgi:hypothetical protein